MVEGALSFFARPGFVKDPGQGDEWDPEKMSGILRCCRGIDANVEPMPDVHLFSGPDTKKWVGRELVTMNG